MPADTHSSFLFFNFIFSLIMAFTCAYLAGKRGRHVAMWFTLGLFTGVFALLALFLFFPAIKKEIVKAQDIAPAPVQAEKETQTSQAVAADENVLWYYLDRERKQQGPVSFVALKELWNRGELEEKSYVWCEHMTQWQRVEILTDLLTILNSSKH